MSEPKTVAVIGASSDRRKFGNKAVRAFAAAGWRVLPINPNESTVENLPAYPALESAPQPFDAITLYVPPQVLMKLLPAIAQAGAAKVWFNPGTANEAVRAEAARLRIPAIYACSILEIGQTPSHFPDF